MPHSTLLSESAPPGYIAARSSAALHDQNSHGRIWLAGDDRVAFLQRISTNDVRLRPGQGTVTILISPTARIVAALTVQAHADGLLLITGADQGPSVFMTLRSLIFFSDKVTLSGRGAALAQFGPYGPGAAAALQAVGAGDLAALETYSWSQQTLAGQPCTVQRVEGLGSDAFTILAPAPTSALVQTALQEAGVETLSEEAFNVLRVEAGVPAPGIELNEQVSPLEAGLRRFCNDFKGCYTGQEIIARQITYDKVTTRLVGLLPDGPLLPTAEVVVDDKKVGWVSSAVRSVALDRPIALAFLRRPHNEPGAQVQVRIGDQTIPARVTTLPFTSA